jgi:simple sugar transport system substrate-binding protein
LSESPDFIRRRKMRKNFARLAIFAVILMLVLSACGGAPAANQAPAAPATQAPATDESATQAPAGPFVFGMLLVGAKNDQGWNQAHYDAGLYVEKNLPN